MKFRYVAHNFEVLHMLQHVTVPEINMQHIVRNSTLVGKRLGQNNLLKGLVSVR